MTYDIYGWVEVAKSHDSADVWTVVLDLGEFVGCPDEFSASAFGLSKFVDRRYAAFFERAVPSDCSTKVRDELDAISSFEREEGNDVGFHGYTYAEGNFDSAEQQLEFATAEGGCDSKAGRVFGPGSTFHRLGTMVSILPNNYINRTAASLRAARAITCRVRINEMGGKLVCVLAVIGSALSWVHAESVSNVAVVDVAGFRAEHV